MKYKQGQGAGQGWETPTTTTGDGGATTHVIEVKLTNNEVMVYKRRVKEVLDEMVENNPVLQKSVSRKLSIFLNYKC